MRKIVYWILSFILILTTLFSCDVTRDPKVNPKQSPFRSISMARQNRDALYAILRNVESPNNLNVVDIQSDLYHLTAFDDNSRNGLYNWLRQSITDNPLILGYYKSFYDILMQSNNFLWRAQELLDSDQYSLTEEERELLGQYIGEAKVMRALAHWRLVIRFSKPWDGKTDNDQYSGIIQILSNDPIARSLDPKSSRAEVYKQAIKDLDEAIAAIPNSANKDVKPAVYITRDYAYAVKARVCLFMHDWEGALNAVNQFVGNYPLTKMTGNQADDVIALGRIWRTEDSDEIMLRLYASPQIGATSSFLYAGSMQMARRNPQSSDLELLHHIQPSLILEKWVCDLYEEKDIRKQVYIGVRPLDKETSGIDFFAITKYEGNPSLDKDKNIREDKFGVHLFNVGEAYLIKAEALLKLDRTAEALRVLSELRAARGLTTSEDDYGTKKEINTLLREERVRELVAEGWRLNDLLRWKMSMKRGERQQALSPLPDDFKEIERILDRFIHRGGRLLEKDPETEQMFVWEFPTRDLENNTNLNENRNWK